MIVQTGVECRADAHALGPHAHDDVLAQAQVRAALATQDLPIGLDFAARAAQLDDAASEEDGFADELGREDGVRPLVDLGRRPVLHDHALVHDHHPVRHRQRLFLVVRHVDERGPEATVDVDQLDLHLLAKLEIEGAERFVEQQDLRLQHQRPSQGDALGLSAAQLLGIAVLVPGHLDQLEHTAHVLGDLRPGQMLHQQPKGDVLRHRLVREESPALKHHVDGPPVRGPVGDVLALQVDAAARRTPEACAGAQQGGLAAAAGPKQGEELPGLDFERHVVERHDVPEVLGNPLKPHDRGRGRSHLIPGGAGSSRVAEAATAHHR